MIIRNIVCAYLCLFVPAVFASQDELQSELQEQYFLYAVAIVSEEFKTSTTICQKHLKELSAAVDDRKQWALRMLDASAQQEQGYLFGNTFWLGSLSHCRDISTLTKRIDKEEINDMPPFEIEFMTGLLNHNNVVQLQYRLEFNNDFVQVGLCMPKSCTTEELSTYLDRFLEKKYLLLQQIYPVHLNVSEVKTLNSPEFNWRNDSMIVVTTTIVSITLLLITLGTWYDIFYYQSYLKLKEDMKKIPSDADNNTQILIEPTLAGKILLCYSVHSNLKNIFTVSTTPTTLPFVHGIKAIFMIYIITGHVTALQHINLANPIIVFRITAQFVQHVIGNASYTVDTYFCLGGFLISYLFYKMEKEKKPYKIISGVQQYLNMILHRYIRLSPAYIAVILLTYSVSVMTDQEYPFIHKNKLGTVESTCSTYWWRNLLYISTFYPKEDICLMWSWYLSNDMQFYVVNCLLLLLSTMYLKPILIIIGALPIVSIISGGYTSYIHNYRPTLDEALNEMEVMYFPFLLRMGPYFVGVLAGYFINKWNNTIPFRKSTISKFSYAALFSIIAILQGAYFINQGQLSNAYVAVYMGISRTLWGISIAWLIMTCISGNGGLFNRFLSLRGFVPISRLSYSLYLVHPVVILLFAYTAEHGNNVSYSFTVQSTVGVFAVSSAAATIVALMFESPYALLLNLLLRKKK